MMAVRIGDYSQFQFLKKISQLCNKLILAVPDSSFDFCTDTETVYDYFNDIRFIDKVVYVNSNDISYYSLP